MKKITLKILDAKLNKILKLLEGEPQEIKAETKDNLITIKDDGKKKTSEILNDCRKLFQVWSYYSDKDLDRMFPSVKSEYKYRYIQEADENLKNMSVDNLDKKGIKSITLRERLLFELIYFEKENKHLDVDNVTLCSGSRYSDGSVPIVVWNSRYDELSVCRCGSDDAVDRLRSREQF